MRYKILCIRDRAADTFGQPMFFPQIGQAVRGFSDEIKRVHENNNMNKHPEDFDLFHMGEWDDEAGTFEGIRPVQVAIGKDYV